MALEYTRGQAAILYGTFAVDSVPTNPTDLQVTIYHDGDVVLGPVTPTNISTGYYNYEFVVPDDWDVDFYDALWSGTLNSINFKDHDTFKVVASEALDEASLPSGYYCTLADVIDELYGVDFGELSEYSTRIVNDIPRSHEEVNRRLGRDFMRQTRVDFVDGSTKHALRVPYRPVISVSDCSIFLYPSSAWYTFQNIFHHNVRGTLGKTLRTQNSNAEYSACDLMVDCAAGILEIPDSILYTASMSFPYWDRTFEKGRRNVRITYSCGYATTDIPQQITEMCSKLTAIRALQWKGNIIAGGAQGISGGPANANFGSIPYAGLIQMFRERIEEITDSFREPGVS